MCESELLLLKACRSASTELRRCCSCTSTSCRSWLSSSCLQVAVQVLSLLHQAALRLQRCLCVRREFSRQRRKSSRALGSAPFSRHMVYTACKLRLLCAQRTRCVCSCGCHSLGLGHALLEPARPFTYPCKSLPSHGSQCYHGS